MSESAAAPSQYVGRIDLRVANNSHTIAYNAIAAHTRGVPGRILDVGCSTGYFGAALREAGHEVWGVEYSPAAAKVAEQNLDRVIAGRIEDALASLQQSAVRFDVITLGDVLEHLADSSAVLREFSSLLADGGAIIVSVPNVAHAAVRLMLLEGRWEYSKLGILDDTHLRFFTKRSLVELFTATGYAIRAIAQVRLPPEATGIAVNRDLLDAMAEHLDDDAADVFQFVAVVVPENDPARVSAANAKFIPGASPRVLVVMPIEDWSLGQLRLRRPLAKWAEVSGGEVRVRWMGSYTQRDMLWADIVVLQREASPAVLALIDVIHALGKRVVFDIDDLLTDVPEFLTVHQHCTTMRPFLQAALSSADAVTVTTPRLAAALADCRADPHVVPNCSGPIGARATHYADAAGPVTLFVASTDTVRVDFIVPALRRILDDPELAVQVVAIGPPGAFLTGSGIEAACIDILEYDGFRQFVAAHDNAIGIIPLDDSRFSSCKSPVKYLDYAMGGVVCVCSRVPPYAGLIDDGRTGMLVDNDADNWYRAIRALVLDPARRAAIAAAAAAMCERDYSMGVAAAHWQDVISAVGARAIEPLARAHRPPPPRLRDWIRLLAQPAAYRSGARIIAKEGIGGISTRIGRLYRR